MKFHNNHLLIVVSLVLLCTLKLQASGITPTSVVKRKLNANFLPSQCWEPTKQTPVLSLVVDAENKTTTLQQTNSSSTDGVIANNDLRAYYYYLSDPE
jgi:hypothetical protein